MLDRHRDLLARAAASALSVARWEVADLLSRRPAQLAPDLLAGRAAELSLSPFAADQLLSVALDRAADDLRHHREPLRDDTLFERPEPSERSRLVLSLLPQLGSGDFVRDLGLVDELEARQRALGYEGVELSARLTDDAALQEQLWTDPRIPADTAVRQMMALSAPQILERAEQLLSAPSRRPGAEAAPSEADEIESLRRPPILIGAADHVQLQRLALESLLSAPRAAAPLLREIDRADVVPQGLLPPHVVRVGNWVTYADLLAGRSDRIRLVCTRQEPGPGALSVLSAVGAALIGLSVGQSILWRDHFGLEHLVAVHEVAAAEP